MKKAFYIIVCILLGSSMNSQVISEIHIADGKWYIEIINPDGIKYKKLTLAVKDSVKVGEVKQSVIDSLQKKDALVVLTADSLNNAIQFYNKDEIYCIVDDSVSFEDKGLRYMEPVEVLLERGCGSGIVCPYWEIYLGHPIKGESIVRIDSTGFDCAKQYTGRGKPSLGKPSSNDDVFVEITGELINSDCFIENEGIQFWNMLHGWKSIECKENFPINSENKFTFLTVPYGHEKSISSKHEYPVIDRFNCIYGAEPTYSDSIFAGYMVSIVPIQGDKSYPVDLFIGKPEFQFEVFYVVSIEELKASTALTCSPNPASNYVKVKYSIVETASWKDCSIIISNTQGQAVLQTPIETPKGEVEINLPSTLAKGLYYCSVAYKGQAVKTVQLLVK